MLDTIQSNPGIVVAPFMIFSIVIAVLCWIAMLGGSLKFSISLCSDASPSYLRCLVMVFLIIVINALVFIGFFATMGPQPWYILASYQLVLQGILVALLAGCDPIRGMVAALAHSLFSTIGTVVILIGFVLTIGPALKGMEKREGNFLARDAVATETENPFVTPVSNRQGLKENPFAE